MIMAHGMKTFVFSGVAALALLAGSTGAAFAATADVTIEAEIVAALTVTEAQELNFGAASSSGVAGTVVVATDGNRNCTGGVTCVGSTAQAAEVLIVGTVGQGVDITLPGSVVVASGGDQMDVDTFDASTLTPTLDGNGEARVQIGEIGRASCRERVSHGV